MQSAPARAADKLEVVRASPTCALGRFGALILVNWRGRVTHEDVQAVVELRSELLRSGGFCGAIHIGEAGLPVPEESVREAARRALGMRRDNAAAIALVILGEGFGASAIRSVGTAVFALRGVPTRLFARAEEAAKWMVEEMQAYDDELALAAACRALREAKL